MWPRLAQAYLANYYAHAEVYALVSDRGADYANVIADKCRLITGCLKMLAGAPNDGLAVDYGAGHGATVKALSQLGFDAVGVEISANARAAASDLFGVEMRDQDISEFAPSSISLLTMFDVVEHLLEPKTFLRTAFEKIRPGGACLIGVPNYDALDRMIMGAKSKALIFPEHVNQFTKESLRRLLIASGFGVHYIGSPPPYGVAITLGLRRALMRVFGHNPVTEAIRDMLVWIKRYIVYPLPNAFVETSGLLGQSLLILAQRRP
jgi:2-polyprenyl-3-methyl-5-hydroxy-6-metoxy-1,4-benzoquinol methylase